MGRNYNYWNPDELVGEQVESAMHVPVENGIDQIVFNIDLHCFRPCLLMPGGEIVKTASPLFSRFGGVCTQDCLDNKCHQDSMIKL